MGAGQSATSSEVQSPSRALHVLRVTPSSPASQSDIEPFFDFVVGFEGDALSSQHSIDVTGLEKIVERHEGRTLNLLVWSSKKRETRVVPITPSREWSSPHSDVPRQNFESSPQPSLLGLSMRMCEPALSLENVWHVLDVLEGSPAESAGLVPYGDWIVGWSGGVLSAENDFYDLVEAHVDKPLRVYVYSYDFDTLREVLLVPNRQWDGEGLLGCVFGFGLLHRIPSPSAERQPGEIPLALQEENDEYEEQGLFVPADVHPSQGPPIHVPHHREDWKKPFEQKPSTLEPARGESLDHYHVHDSRFHGSESDSEHGADHHEFHDHDHGHPHEVHPVVISQTSPIPQRSRTSPSIAPAPLARSIFNGTSTQTLGFLTHSERIISRPQTPTTPRHRLIPSESDGDGGGAGVSSVEMGSSTDSLTSVD